MTCESALAESLASWRAANGWTQKAAAKATGIPHATWVGYENAQRQPGAHALAAIGRAGCDVGWLLTGTRSAPQSPLSAADLAAVVREALSSDIVQEAFRGSLSIMSRAR
jgi:transcriptional regulator with XRE-family HTH domain